jgi:Uncharacterized alpha/beta hydrolase domain (DUF2235)
MAQTAVQDPTYIPGQTDREAGLADPVQGTQSSQTARRAPGQRALSGREREQRQIALGATVPSKQEAMCQCTQVIHYSVFFDGTGNNRSLEMAKPVSERALSNIAKLFDAHKDSTGGVIRAYVPGVGTPYPEIGDNGGSLAQAIGTGADRRVKKALEMLDEEIAKVPAQQKILLINVVVFGFSRGAAQTRAFIRDLASKCQSEDGGYVYKGAPLRIAFAGIFDTVCSAYGSLASAAVSSKGGHNGWAHDMKLPPMVEQSVHMMAAHESRRRFPLDSTRIDAAYPDNTIEVWYPGVHADVGGGYAPQYQGRENTISRFALNEMFDVSFTAGVLFNPVSDLDPEIQDEFSKDDPDLRAAFNAYLDAVPKKTGPMEEVQAAHMLLLHRWLKQRVDPKSSSTSLARLKQARADKKREADDLNRKRWALQGEWGVTGPNDMRLSEARRQELRAVWDQHQDARTKYLELDDAVEDLAEEDAKYLDDVAEIQRHAEAGVKLNLRERTIKAAWDDPTPLPEPVKTFFDLFAHDSVAHFDYDTSRLTDWRTIYFGDTKYKPS